MMSLNQFGGEVLAMKIGSWTAAYVFQAAITISLGLVLIELVSQLP